MPLDGAAFLALWNDRSPKRGDYDVWHSREHVPERLSVPGMVRATRYCDGKGNLPAYFTLYVLENIEVLDRPEYIRLLHNPTRWSRSMRPDFSRFFRLPCDARLSTGGGIGGWAVICLVAHEPEPARIQELVSALTQQAPVTTVHYGTLNHKAAAVPFDIAVDDPDPPYGVLIVEGFEEHSLVADVRRVLDDHAGNVQTTDLTSYRLAFVLAAESVIDVHPYSPPDIPE